MQLLNSAVPYTAICYNKEKIKIEIVTIGVDGFVKWMSLDVKAAATLMMILGTTTMTTIELHGRRT